MRILWLPLAALAVSGATLDYSSVQPILAKRCSGCHQKGEIGPMAFTSYEETRPWAKAIKRTVLARTMPPWHADERTSARIHNSRRLDENEVRQLVAWVDAGAPGGRVAKPVAVAARQEGWRLGKPDMVIRIPGFKVKENGSIQYTFLVTPTGLTEDRWVTAAEWKIDQRGVVHHINAFVRPKGSSYVKQAPPGEFYVATKDERGARREDEREVDRRELLVGYEPGYAPQPWGPQRGKLLRAGSDIVFEMHYTPNGKPAADYSELGLYFAKEPPPERVFMITPADSKLNIPPGEANYRSFVYAELMQDARLIAMQPHMHLRGKAYKIEAVYPGGERDLLLDVPKYDFNWQTTYFLKSPIALPKGTKLECTAWFDNSPNNPHNPDPAKTIQWGDQSWEEMNVGFMEIAIDRRADNDIVRLSDTTKPTGSR